MCLFYFIVLIGLFIDIYVPVSTVKKEMHQCLYMLFEL